MHIHLIMQCSHYKSFENKYIGYTDAKIKILHWIYYSRKDQIQKIDKPLFLTIKSINVI